jgi:hypothetical protein
VRLSEILVGEPVHTPINFEPIAEHYRELRFGGSPFAWGIFHF